MATPANAGDDPSEWILDALLAPVIDPQDRPLRWSDPRVAMGCNAATQIYVDRQPLQAGTEVPIVPFILDWNAHGCHPFGEGGPRVDGRVRLTVFHEDWGFSAMVEPAGMRVILADGRIVHLRPGSAKLLATVE
jgi:hypothetical protein